MKLSIRLAIALTALAGFGASADAHPEVIKRKPHEAESRKAHEAPSRKPHQAASHPKPQKPPKRETAVHVKPPKAAKH
jgi:hypothetical protein